MIDSQPSVVDVSTHLSWFHRDSHYTFITALADISGIGAIYHIGSDCANLQRTKRALTWIQDVRPSIDRSGQRICDENKAHFTDERATVLRSLISKVAYLGMLSLIIAGACLSSNFLLTMGIIGAVGLAAFFMGRAGYESLTDFSYVENL